MLRNKQTKKVSGQKVTLKQTPKHFRPHKQLEQHRQLFSTTSVASSGPKKVSEHTTVITKPTGNLQLDTNKPLLQIVSFSTNRELLTSHSLKNRFESENREPTTMTTKLFVQDSNFQQPPIIISQPIHSSTINDLAAQIQKNLPIEPCFVSFSTHDNTFSKFYYHNEIASGPYHQQYSQLGIDLNILKDTVQKSYSLGDDGIGLPPVPMDLSKIKSPIVPQPFFNNPPPEMTKDLQKNNTSQKINNNSNNTITHNNKTNDDNENNNKASHQLKLIFNPSMTPRQRRYIQEQSTSPPKYYQQNSTHIPLHPFTPLNDILHATSVICHISYTQEQIDQCNELKTFVSNNTNITHKNIYPAEIRGNRDITTISYEITQYHDFYGQKLKDYSNSLTLSKNFQDFTGVSPRFLLGCFGTIVAIESYLRLSGMEFEQAIEYWFNDDIGTGRRLAEMMSFTQNPMSELAGLKLEKSTLTGLNTLSQMRTGDSMGIWDRVTGVVSGEVAYDDILSPNLKSKPTDNNDSTGKSE